MKYPRNITYGKRLKAYRLSRNLTRHEVARRAGIDMTHLAALECGKWHVSRHTLASIGRALEADLPPFLLSFGYAPDLSEDLADSLQLHPDLWLAIQSLHDLTPAQQLHVARFLRLANIAAQVDLPVTPETSPILEFMRSWGRDVA